MGNGGMMVALLINPHASIAVERDGDATWLFVELDSETLSDGSHRMGVSCSREQLTRLAGLILCAASGGVDIVGCMEAAEHLVGKLRRTHSTG